MTAHNTVSIIRDEANAQALAEAAANAMFAGDEASKSLGMTIVSVRPGYAQLTMRVRPDMLNGLQSCHGGIIFTLADSAFAYSCNSYNLNTVASGCTIDYLAPGREGDMLTAEAVEQSRAGRTGVYDVTVINQDGDRIALFAESPIRSRARFWQATQVEHGKQSMADLNICEHSIAEPISRSSSFPLPGGRLGWG